MTSRSFPAGTRCTFITASSVPVRSEERGTLCCFDPAFQAGYPKTPVFDGSSRPAEFFLWLANGKFSPRTYKIGVAVSLCLIPLALALATWGLGLRPGAILLASALAAIICWGDPCRAMIESGDIDLVLAVLAAVVQVGLLVRFDRRPGMRTWLGLLASGCLGWFTQPLLFLGLMLVLLPTYYLSAGVRHGLSWHLFMVLGLAGGVAVNAFWLLDWVGYWWVLAPLQIGHRLLAHRTFQSFWAAAIWGQASDRALAMALLGSGMVGLIVFNQTKGRTAARLLGLGCGGLLALTLGAVGWEPLGRVGLAKLLAPALWFAVLPAVHAWGEIYCWINRYMGRPWLTAGCAGALLFAGGWRALPWLEPYVTHCQKAEPLAIGLGPNRQALVEAICQVTNPEARVLWEDRPEAGKEFRLDGLTAASDGSIVHGWFGPWQRGGIYLHRFGRWTACRPTGGSLAGCRFMRILPALQPGLGGLLVAEDRRASPSLETSDTGCNPGS